MENIWRTNRFGDPILREDKGRRAENGSQNFGLRDWVEIAAIQIQEEEQICRQKILVLGRLRLRCLDGQADMNLDMRRKARNVELRVITINSLGRCHELI